MSHPKKKDTDLVIAVGSSSIAPNEMVPFERYVDKTKKKNIQVLCLSVFILYCNICIFVCFQFFSVKSLQFLTAVLSQDVPRVKPTTNAPLMAEKSLRKMVVQVQNTRQHISGAIQ